MKAGYRNPTILEIVDADRPKAIIMKSAAIAPIARNSFGTFVWS